MSNENGDDTTLDMEPGEATGAVEAVHDIARGLSVPQQAAEDTARIVALAEGDAHSVVAGPVGQVLTVGSSYKMRLLTAQLIGAYIRGAAMGSQLALEQLVRTDQRQAGVLDREAKAAGLVEKVEVVERSVELCPSMSSVDGKCTLCHAPWTTLTHGA